MRHGKTTSSIGLAATALFAAACTEAPVMTGSDQVHDANVTLTAFKDNHFEQMSWADVDNVIVNALVPNPESEPGCALGIVRDGEILYLQGYGYARMPGGGSPSRKWGVGTMGAVGSVSKTITAAAMLSMLDDGDLALNDIVGDHLTTTNAPLASRTLESLLTHASGIGGASQGAAFSPDFEPASGAFLCQTNPGLAPPGYCAVLPSQLASPLVAFASYEASEQVTFLAPGAPLDAGVYSNVGMSVAGAVIDAVSRSSTLSDGYEAYVWDELGQWSNNALNAGHLNSLALTHSWRSSDIPNRAVGYGDSPFFPVFEAWSETAGIEGWEGPSGGWAMTIGDLARFMIALDESEFFADPTLLGLMRAPHTDLAGFSDHYGMGMFLDFGTSQGADYHHGGDIGGHHAYWAWWDDYDGHEIGIGLMCNRDDLNSATLYSSMIWQSGDQLEETLVWLAANQNPDPPSQIVYGAVAEHEVEGVDFELSAEKAWLVGGQQLAIPFGLADLDLFLSVDDFQPRAGSGPTFVFGQGRVDSSGVPTIPNPVLLESADYKNPTFMTAPIAMSFGNTMGSVYVQDLVLEGSFSEGGRSIEAVSLSGRLDTRDAGALGYDPMDGDACEDVRLAGGECEPCADGERFCLGFRYENLQGIPVPEPGFAGALMWSLVSLVLLERRRKSA